MTRASILLTISLKAGTKRSCFAWYQPFPIFCCAQACAQHQTELSLSLMKITVLGQISGAFIACRQGLNPAPRTASPPPADRSRARGRNSPRAPSLCNKTYTAGLDSPHHHGPPSHPRYAARAAALRPRDSPRKPPRSPAAARAHLSPSVPAHPPRRCFHWPTPTVRRSDGSVNTT